MSLLEKARKYLAGIKEILSIVWSASKGLTIMLVLNNIFRNALWPVRALAEKGIVDAVVALSTYEYSEEVQTRLILNLILFFATFTANRIWWPLNSYTQTLMLAKIGHEVRNRIMDTVRKASLEFFDRNECYNILENASAQANGRRSIGVINNIINFVTTVISFVIAFIPMLMLNWVLTLFLILSSVPGILLENRFGQKQYLYEKETAQQRRKMNYAFDLYLQACKRGFSRHYTLPERRYNLRTGNTQGIDWIKRGVCKTV